MPGKRSMPRFTLAFGALLSFLASPCDAADRTHGVRLRFLSVTTNGDARLLGGKLALEDTTGYDVAYFHQIAGPVFVEASAGFTQFDGRFESAATGEIAYGEIDAIPFSLLLQFRMNRSSGFEPYAGVGFTYIDFDVKESDEFLALFPGFAVETIADDQEGPTLQVGFDYRFGVEGQFSIGVDARYTVLDTTGLVLLDGDQFSAFNLEVNPLLAGVSLALRF